MSEKKKPLVILTGPTAVGKTELSIKLAKRINGEIISADSIQVYKYMDIGSAKITEDEMEGVKHYLVDELDPSCDFSVFKFKKMADECIDEICTKGKIPIIVGGTGFYIQAVLYDIDFKNEESDKEYRKSLIDIYEKEGAGKLFEMLKKVDKESAENIHQNNVKRVIRALEYYHLNGEKISVHNEKERKKQSPYNFKYFVLNMDRELLYSRIDKRVDIMIEKGLKDEVKKLLEMNYDRNLTSMQGIGYREMAAYLNNELSFDETISLIKKNTRHFAKRQLTWFKREKDINWINKEEFEFNDDKILDYIINSLHNIIM